MMPEVSRYPVDLGSPAFHWHMLRNARKYHAIADVFSQYVRGRSVLDLGTGTGVLAFLAYHHGACPILGVEREEIIRVAEDYVVSAALPKNTISFRRADVMDLEIGGPYDIIISETVGYLGVEENILSIMSRARERWLSPGGVLMPRRLDVLLQPLFIGNVDSSADEQCLTELQALLLPQALPFLSTRPIAPIVAELHGGATSFSIGEEYAPPYAIRSHWRVGAEGQIGGTVATTKAWLDDTTWIGSASADNSWPHVIIPLQPIKVGPGDDIVFEMSLIPQNSAFHCKFVVYMNDCVCRESGFLTSSISVAW